MDAPNGFRENRTMGRYTFPAFNKAPTPRYLVIWNLYWQVIDSRCLEPATDLGVAMAAAIERLEAEGWQAEGSAEYGFVFIRRGTDRRLLTLTERDPYSTTSQSFSPFRSVVR
jgi:hypothetical protein